MFQTACFVLFLQLIQTGIFDAFHYTGRLNVSDGLLCVFLQLIQTGIFDAFQTAFCRPSECFRSRTD